MTVRNLPPLVTVAHRAYLAKPVRFTYEYRPPCLSRLSVCAALDGRALAGGVVDPLPMVGGLVRVLGGACVAARDGMPGANDLSSPLLDVSPAVAFRGLIVRVRINLVQTGRVIWRWFGLPHVGCAS